MLPDRLCDRATMPGKWCSNRPIENIMPRHELILPDLGLDNVPITLSVWLAERDSRVAEDEPVVEVLAGPATVDLPSPADGVLTELLVTEDEPIEVGQVLAVIEG